MRTILTLIEEAITTTTTTTIQQVTVTTTMAQVIPIIPSVSYSNTYSRLYILRNIYSKVLVIKRFIPILEKVNMNK